MQYNELSQLETNYLHGDATNALQQQSYAYNIRGWLTGINNIFQGSSGVFAQKLYYNTVPQGTSSQATARYNGNISASEWRVDGITPTDFSSGYAFSYDALNRLTKSAYYKRNTSTTMIAWEGTASNKGSWGAITGIGSEKDITYDKNGNIRTLSRHGRRDSDTDIVLFDNLSYSYEGNRLKSVYDAVAGQNSLGDFPGDGSGIAATFRYDANGNMSGDPVRGLKLSYNQLNMPTIIQHTKGRIENTYAWDGSKRRRVVLDYNNNTLSDECYYGDLVVENGQPTRILHGEGYVDINRMPVFNYHLKDHLGNVRAVISSSYGPGAYTLSQASDYYPFGMALTMEFAAKAAGKAFTEIGKALPTKDIIDDSKTFTRSNAYLYNGKEEQPMPGKWLDYGARFYDPQLGRWHSVDPLADHPYQIDKSTYAAFWNNPIVFIDLDGRCPDCPDPSTANEGDIVNPNGGMYFIFREGEWTGIGGTLDEVTKIAQRNENNVGFGSGVVDGFGAGIGSTVDFIANMGTTQGWKDLGQGMFDITMLGCQTCPQGMMIRNEMADRMIDYFQNIPSMTDYEMGYDLGFGAEKIAEAALISKGTEFGISAARYGLGEAMWQSSTLGPRSMLFGRYHSKFVPHGRRGILNTGMKTGVGWSNHGTRHVFRAKFNGNKYFQVYK